MAFIKDVAVNLTGVDSMHNKKHVHRNGIEIMYFTKGKGFFLVDAKVFNIKPNMLIFIDSDTLHCSNHSMECEYIRDRVLFGKDEFLDFLSICEIEKEDILQKCFFVDEDIHYLFEALSSVTDGIEKINIAIKIIKSCTYENVGEKTLIDKILLYIDNNLENTLNAKSISEYVHISASYLCHLFKEKTGFALMEYIKLRRVNKAKVLLKTTRKTVSQVSVLCGYDNFSHFSRVFHQIEGISPSEYRKKFKG